MSTYQGRYFSGRDVRLINSINSELMADIIQHDVIVYKIDPKYTNTNVYGESEQEGKYYFPGVKITCIIEPEEQNVTTDTGVSVSRSSIFNMHRLALEKQQIYPELGDVIEWDLSYYEINRVVENQLLGGQYNKNFSVITYAHRTKLSNLNISPIRK